MLSIVVLIPEEKIGFAILTNKLPNAAYVAMSHYLTEKLLDVPSQDWIQNYVEIEKEVREKASQAKQKVNDARAQNTHPSFELEKYAGAYENALLGGATIGLEGDALSGEAVSKRSGFHIQLHVNESLSGTLEHWHYDSFVCTWDNPVLGESLIPFITDGQGQVAEFRVKIREDWIDPVEHVFRKIN